MTEQVTEERRTDQINLSPVAAAKVSSLLEQEGRDDLQLRISVQPGGCSGLRYQLFFDERTLDGDAVTDFDGVAVVVDRMSVPYLNGAQIAAEAVRPCVALAGQVLVGAREMRALGIESAYSLVDLVGEERALADPARSLAELAARVARTWSR